MTKYRQQIDTLFGVIYDGNVVKLSIGQRKALSEFFTNTAVAWLTAGIITPFFLSRKIIDILIFSFWGLIFTAAFLSISLYFTKGIKT